VCVAVAVWRARYRPAGSASDKGRANGEHFRDARHGYVVGFGHDDDDDAGHGAGNAPSEVGGLKKANFTRYEVKSVRRAAFTSSGV